MNRIGNLICLLGAEFLEKIKRRYGKVLCAYEKNVKSRYLFFITKNRKYIQFYMGRGYLVDICITFYHLYHNIIYMLYIYFLLCFSFTERIALKRS